jgi:hypothetical protein
VSDYAALRAEFLRLLVLPPGKQWDDEVFASPDQGGYALSYEPELSAVMRQFDRAVANLEGVPGGVDR